MTLPITKHPIGTQKGISDFIICMDGIFVAAELKAAGGTDVTSPKAFYKGNTEVWRYRWYLLQAP